LLSLSPLVAFSFEAWAFFSLGASYLCKPLFIFLLNNYVAYSFCLLRHCIWHFDL
jgi:hypothetical protein